jgi:hypothetical protein
MAKKKKRYKTKVGNKWERTERGRATVETRGGK